jgi:predicted O-methyltransferase YrrM
LGKRKVVISAFMHLLLAQIRATPNDRILEIGIYRGGSHRAWRGLTIHTKVYGIDIDPATLIQEEQIVSAIGDQIRLESLDSAVKKLGGSFDLVIDDGWHQPEAGLKSLHLLLPRLRQGGCYVLENIDARTHGRLWRRFAMQFPLPFVAQILTEVEIPELLNSGYEILIIRRLSDATPRD